MNKKLLNILKILVSVVLMYLLVRKIGVSQFVEVLNGLNIYYLGLAVIFFLIGFCIQAERLRTIIRTQGIEINYKKVFNFNLLSTFFGIFLPTIIGGDVVKMALLSSHSGKKAVSMGTVAMDRVIGTYALVLVALISGILGRQFLSHDVILYTVIAFSIAFIFLVALNVKSLWKIIWNFIKPYLNNKYDSINTFVITLQSYGIFEKTFLKAFFWSLLFYSSIIISNYYVSLSLGLNINILVFFVFVPLLSLVSMAPISISGIGVRESVSVIFFSTMGVAPSFGALLSFLPFVFKATIGLVGGIIYLISGLKRDKK